MRADYQFSRDDDILKRGEVPQVHVQITIEAERVRAIDLAKGDGRVVRVWALFGAGFVTIPGDDRWCPGQKPEGLRGP